MCEVREPDSAWKLSIPASTDAKDIQKTTAEVAKAFGQPVGFLVGFRRWNVGVGVGVGSGCVKEKMNKGLHF